MNASYFLSYIQWQSGDSVNYFIEDFFLTDSVNFGNRYVSGLFMT